MEERGQLWRKSSYSGSNEGNCVELGQSRAATQPGAGTRPRAAILVRDTTDRAGYTLPASLDAWRNFTLSIQRL